MSSSQSGHVVHGGRALFLLAVVASLGLGVVTSEDNNPFTSVDCQPSSASSPSPAPLPPSSNNSNHPNSTSFRSNVVALLDALPSAAAPMGFASLSRGRGTDRAFVRGICRGDSAPGDCATYLRSAARNITSRCNDTSRRAGIWFDKCFVSYADTDASNAHEQEFRSILYNTGKVGNQDAFEVSYYALMRRLAARVVNGTGGTSSSSLPSAPMFATGEVVYDAAAPNGTMYGLLQCMRDRNATAAECDQCLQDSIRQLPGCCYGHQGGVVLGYHCNLRVEIYTYYNLALDAPPPLAPAPSSFIKTQKRGNLLLLAACVYEQLCIHRAFFIIMYVGTVTTAHLQPPSRPYPLDTCLPHPPLEPPAETGDFVRV